MTKAERKLIRLAFAEPGVTFQSLAERFGLTQGTIFSALGFRGGNWNGGRWKKRRPRKEWPHRGNTTERMSLTKEN